MPVFDFSAAPADNNEKKSQCTYTTFHSNETTATPEKPVLILDNSKREWKHHSCGYFSIRRNRQLLSLKKMTVFFRQISERLIPVSQA